MDLTTLFASPREKPPNNAYVKRTLLHLPIITNIVPEFRVSLLKPRTGLTSTSINDENDQTLHVPEQDSYFGDDMSDDDGDILWNVEQKTHEQVPEEYANVSVLVKTSLIAVNGVEFALNSAIRDSTLVPGNAGAEDLLFLLLKSGFLLLIRLWLVPRAFSDTSYTRDSEEVRTPTSHVYKPFVVQWWKASAIDAVETSGNQVSAHASGLAVISASASSAFRIHMCQHTETGMQLTAHHNVPVNGIILHSCFAQPISQATGDNHIMFLTLTFTYLRRIELSLYSWYVSESLANNLEKCTLPLDNSFPTPVHVVPLANNTSFLFVCQYEFIIVTVHNISSADYAFARFPYSGSFPTAHYIPGAPILSFGDENTDEVLIASDSGCVYSIIVSGNSKLTAQPIVRISDPISVFTFRSTSSGYNLTYASDTGGSKELTIHQLFSREYLSSIEDGQKLAYSDATLTRDHKNWAPVLDVLVIDSYKSRNHSNYTLQEFWALTGIGRRARLTNLSTGYLTKKESTTFERLRKTEGLFYIEIFGRKFLITSMPFETKMLEYGSEMESSDEESATEDTLVEIEGPALCTEDCSILVSTIEETIVQFTAFAVTFSNLQRMKQTKLEKRILFVGVLNTVGALVMENNDELSIEVVGIEVPKVYETEDSGELHSLASTPLPYQVSMLKIFPMEQEGQIAIVIGSFDEALHVYLFDPVSGLILEHSLLDLKGSTHGFSPVSQSESFIAHDAVHSSGRLFVGTKTGQFLQFSVSSNFELKLEQSLSLGSTPMSFSLVGSDHNLLFVHLRNLWLFNFYESKLPLRVVFDEKIERSVTRMVEIPTEEPQNARFAFVREDGVTIGSVFCHKSPIVKLISVGEAAKKLVFLDSMNLFSIMCKSRDALSRLKFIDRKLYKLLPSVEIDSRLGTQRKDPIFGPNELPLCCFVWEIERQDRVSKKLIVGSLVDGATGSFKILDINKFALPDSDFPGVKVVELISISRDEPVTCIQQIGSTIFFSSGRNIFSTSYSMDKRKLRPVQKLRMLASDIISMSVGLDNTLIATTRMDSLSVFSYHNDGILDYDDNIEMDPPVAENNLKEDLDLVHFDSGSRCLVNHAKLDSNLIAGDKLHSSLLIMGPSISTSLDSVFSYRMSVIPRVFISRFHGAWIKSDDAKEHILSVGVNGEIVVFDPVFDGGKEISELKNELTLQNKLKPNDTIESLVERLERPFTDKVTGKGFQNIYKPFFDFVENKGKVIDYDLDDILASHSSSITL